MNPFVIKVVMMFFRYGLMAVAGAIGLAPTMDKLISENFVDYEQVVTGLVITLGTMGYGFYRKFRDEQKLKTAQAASGPVTEHQVEARIKLGVGATVTTPKDQIPQPS